MSPNTHIYTSIDDLCTLLPDFREKAGAPPAQPPRGMVGFDGFIDTFIRMQQPDSMAEFGPKVAKAAGIAASYSVQHQGDKFGGNGPLFAAAFSDLFENRVELSYVGGLGEGEAEPIFAEALKGKVQQIYSIAPPAHSDCLEFTDGKIMLGDFAACAEVTLENMQARMGQEAIDRELQEAAFLSAVNWGKLPRVGEIWSYLAERSAELGRNPKEVFLFMDLAEFEHRREEEVQELIRRLPALTAQFNSLLSFNLKEAWQMGERFGGDFQGKKDPESVTDLAVLLRQNLDVDKVIIHPNSGAACANADSCCFVPGPYCQSPLISTGAGDNFGAGCMAACLLGMENEGMLLAGNSTSGYFVRSGRTPSMQELISFVESWAAGSLPERL
ncbi:MAG: hypothetical protein ACO3NW_07035 [Kiritimatiellia bacterium]